uniref:acyltransferase n=1 Tax=Alistipes sp. TaxID=1872444 RepID=UPI0040575BDF
MRNKLKHLWSVICFAMIRLPMPSSWRRVLVRCGGVKVLGNRYFFASDIVLDTVYPQNIILHDHIHITTGVRILTHLLDTSNPDRDDIHWIEGRVEICEHAFIGAGSTLSGNIVIGKGAIVGAGSVVTKSIPDYEIWGGNPARFIKKRP